MILENLEALPPHESGALPLFSRHFFPWGALPYPQEHAHLGTLLAAAEDLKDRALARGMIRFQEAALTHHLKPIYSLFTQETGLDFQAIDAASASFFNALQQTATPTFRFADPALALISRRTPTSTVLCVGSGCKSGMGVFLHHDTGVLNFGPQVTPLGDCSGFGLAGKAQEVELQEDDHHFRLSYLTRLAAAHPRETGLPHLKDSGYSGAWVEAEMEGSETELKCVSRLVTFRPLKDFLFSFFCKGAACLVAGSHRLNPASLDRYLGPPQHLFLMDQSGSKICLEPLRGAAQMEVIPLAGGTSFWGADFLVAYTLAAPEISFSLKVK